MSIYKLVAQITSQLLLPVGHVEAGGLEPREVERRVRRARGHGPPGAGVVLGGAHGRDGGAVAVPELEDLAGYLAPAGDAAGAGAVVGAVGGAAVQEVEYGLCHVPREGEAARLVVDHGDLIELVGRVRDAVREGGHRPHEVAPVADDPGGAQDVVRRAARHGEVARRLGLAVGGERREGLGLVHSVK